MSSVRMERRVAEAELDRMLTDYHRSLPFSLRVQFFGREPLRDAINASPDLKNRLVEAVSTYSLTKITNASPAEGAGAAYLVKSKEICVPESALANRNALIFTLGHETQHALSTKGENHRQTLLASGLQEIVLTSPTPHDYTAPINDYVKHVLAEEAQAHIGGFNAVVSALAAKGKATTPEKLYAFCPSEMHSFITAEGTFPNRTYQLKPGLTRELDGSMAMTPGNTEAMTRYYSDQFPGTFGSNQFLNYRQLTILDGWKLAHEYERIGIATLNKSSDQVYKIDFSQLGADTRLLNVPHNGETIASNPIRTRTIQNVQDVLSRRVDLDVLLDDFPSNVVVNRQAAVQRIHAAADAAAPQPSTTTAPDPAQNQLYAQALNGLRWIEHRGIASYEQVTNVAAALALEAHRSGLTSIDRVMTGDNGNIFAVQGSDPNAPTAQRAHVEVATARQQSSEESLASLHMSLAQQQIGAPIQQAQSTKLFL